MKFFHIKYLVISAYLLSVNPLLSFKIDRVILSSNDNPMYLQFWPLVATAWRDLIGIKPTLILISDEYIEVDETLGDVIRVKTIDGVSSASHAQIIRLLAPMYFPNEISLLSDIDMLPLNREYFVDSVKDISEDKFVIYRDHGYGTNSVRFPMCYSAAKGYLFQELFNVQSIEDIPNTIKTWVSYGYGWETDEVTFFKFLAKWKNASSKCVKLHHTSMVPQRIDRADWGYDKQKLKDNYYIDAHLVRPLDQYYKEIKELADDLGLSILS